MNTEALKAEFQIFEECEVVERPFKNYPRRFDSLLKAVMNLDATRAIKLPLMKYGLEKKTALSLLSSLRGKAKKKHGYRLGGTIQEANLFVWRNPN